MRISTKKGKSMWRLRERERERERERMMITSGILYEEKIQE